MAVNALGTLTSDATNVADAATVTIGSKVYTFQTTLTNVDGNVKIGADAATSLANLKAAINLESGAGTKYATLMTAHSECKCTSVTSTTLVVKALSVGTHGNFIPTTETSTHLSWGGSVLASGTGSPETSIAAALSGGQFNALAEQTIRDLIDPDGTA